MMRIKMKLKILAFLFYSTSIIFSQSGALPFSTLQQSAFLFGAGQIGTSIPNDDVLGYYLNPAILGHSARNNHASFSIMPDKTLWSVYGSNRTTFHNYGLNLGYNLKSTGMNLPISVGLGFVHHKIDYGKWGITSEFGPEIIGNSEPYDLFNSFSFGIGIDYFIRLNIGFSLKSFDSQLGGVVINDQINEYSVDGTMIDYGILLTLPISELLNSDKLHIQLDRHTSLTPTTNISFGLSKNNIGDEITYFDEAQKDPLSRTARLGYTFEFGLDLNLEKYTINFFKYSFSAEAQDLLINEPEENITPTDKYQSGLGDINFSDNIISLKSNNKVLVHKGHIIKFFDTFILSTGSFSGRYYDMIQKTSGVGFSSKGLFKLLNPYLEADALKFITEHFVIEYFDTDYIIGNKTFGQGTINFDALSIHFVGFEF
jgi:hypothetical protein